MLTACSNNNQNPEVVERQSSIVSSGDGSFGVIPYGKNLMKSFVFKNNGPNSVIGSATIVGSGFDIALQLGCETIEIGKSCLVKVMFSSANKESGAYTAALKVGDATVSLSASIDSVPEVAYEFSVDGQSVGSTNLNIGELVGNNIKLMTVKVKNNSPRSGQASSLIVSNNRFRVFNNSCNNVLLKPSKSCVVKLLVQGDNTNSSVSTQLTFDGQNKQIAATQVEQILTGQMIAVNSSVTLGDFYQEGINKIQLLKIKNEGNGVGKIETSAVTLPPGYAVLTNDCSNVKPGTSCYIRLLYSSQDLNKGSHTDTVTIGDSDVDLTVNQVTNPNDLQSLNLIVDENIPVGFCAPVSLSLKDSENLDYVSSQSLTITASSSSLYSDNNCTTADNLIIPPFESTKNLFVKHDLAGPRDLQLSIKGKAENKNLYFYNPLVLTTNKANIVVGQQAQISVEGGRGPFNIETLSGGGTLTLGGLYTSDTVGTATFKVTDSVLNQTAQVSINVVAVLTSSISSFEKIVNQNQSIQGQNGLAPYAYSKVSGVGSVDAVTGIYSAGAVAGLVQLKITDSLNQEVLVTGQVYSQLGVSPTNSIIVLAQNQTFTGVGGKPPYVFSKVSGVGDVGSSSGIFSSLTVGSAQIKVVDSLNQEITTGITVNSNIVLTAGNCSSAVPEQVDCTVNSTGGVGDRTYSVDKGTINPSTGVFYGQCDNNLGSSVVTVTDSMGNSGNITLNYPCVHKTCSQLRAQQKGLTSGDYWLDPDGIVRGGTTSPFKVYCDFRSTGTFALMAEKKAADGIYFPSSTSHGGHALGFYNYGPSTNGTFSINLRNYATIPNALIRLEDGIYNYVVTWDGLNTFKYVSSANLSTNPPGKIWSLNNTGFVAPAVGTTLNYDYRELGGPTEDQCAMSERNGTNPHPGISRFYFIGLNPASGWNTNGSQNWCPYGLGAHADYNFDGFAWLGGYRSGSGTAIKVYYQDIYYHHPVSCNDAKQKGIKNIAGTTGNGTYTIDTDGYLYGSNPVDVNCDMETDQYGWQEVSSATLSSTKMLQGKQFVKIGTYISTTGVNSGTQVLGIFGNAVKSQNFLVGKPTLLTTNNYTTHSSPVRGYNYMGGHKWFINNGISSGSLDYAIVFANGVVGSILVGSASDGQVSGSEHAYIYYYRHNYSLWERP